MVNERIRELSEHATLYANDVQDADAYADWYEVRDTKFAELIVRECVEQIKLKGTDWIDWQPSQLGIRLEYVAMAQHIKQHFGVQE